MLAQSQRRGGLKVAITRLFKNGMELNGRIDGEYRAICYMAKFGKRPQHGAHNTCIFLSFPRNYLSFVAERCPFVMFNFVHKAEYGPVFIH